jgi:hypothetical protein
MKIVAISALVLLMLMMGCFTSGKTSAQSAYAETAFQSAYKHGVADGKCADTPGCRDYITQPGNGFAHHTTAFVDEYIKGWCSTANIGRHDAGRIEPNDNPEPTFASFDCIHGLSSAYPSPKN